jgi:hypothetical protein
MKNSIILVTVKDTKQIVNLETISQIFDYVDSNTKEIITRIESKDFEKGYLLSKTSLKEIYGLMGKFQENFINVRSNKSFNETYININFIKEIYQQNDGTKITMETLQTKTISLPQYVKVENSVDNIFSLIKKQKTVIEKPSGFFQFGKKEKISYE